MEATDWSGCSLSRRNQRVSGKLDYLQALLAALKPSCSAGWNGEITSSFTISTSQSDSVPPMKPGVEVTSSTTIYNRNKVDKWTFNGIFPG
jgi:hypothetical protein